LRQMLLKENKKKTITDNKHIIFCFCMKNKSINDSNEPTTSFRMPTPSNSSAHLPKPAPVQFDYAANFPSIRLPMLPGRVVAAI